MPISLNASRPKLNTTNTVNFDIVAGAVTEDGSKLLIPVYIDNLSPDSSPTFACTYTSGSDQITFTNNTGSPISDSVRLGDIITGDATAFPGGDKYVAAISEVGATPGTGSTVTITASANAAANGTDVNLVFDPGTIDSTLYILEINHSSSSTNLVVTPKLYLFDGTLVEDADVDGVDAATVGGASRSLPLSGTTINVDTFFNNARVARTNVT